VVEKKGLLTKYRVIKMQIFNAKTIGKIKANKNLLEKKLKIKINISGRRIDIKGKSFDIFVAERVLEAVDKNFPIDISLLLLDEDYILEELPIKEFTRKKDLSLVRARILGKKGRTIEVISELSDCYVTLTENTVAILGPAEKIKDAEHALKSLISGAKQSKVYSYLEKARKRAPISDIGLRETRKE
jgi:ribosomal RNA assembly protein